MLIYNTTYVLSEEDLACFLVWVRENMMPAVHADGALSNGRLARILSHSGEEGYRFCLQFNVADSATLHKWILRQGRQMEAEQSKIFGDRIMAFATLMEVVE